MVGDIPRAWGFWTEVKLDTLERYLKSFTTASKKADTTLYLDLFAGSVDNVRRDDETRHFSGSTVRALETEPCLTDLFFFELKPKAQLLREDLARRFPGDTRYKIHAGDCNKTISIILGDLQRCDLHWSPTFCFIDPDALDVEWSTLTAISRFKDPKAKTKPEMLILLSHTSIPRLAGWDSAMGLNDKLSSAVTGFFGTEAWKRIFEERLNHGLSADKARRLYTELFRYRIQTVLGYKRTLTIEMGNERGSPVYVLVFATDHDAGIRIMSSVFTKAREQSAEYRTQVNTKRKNTAREAAGEYSLPGLEQDTLTGQPRYFESVQTDEFPNIPAWLMKHI